MSPRIWFWVTIGIILLTIAGAVLTDIPKGPDFFGREIKVHQGLDLQGGAQLVYSGDLSGIEEGERENAMDSVTQVIRKRIDALGVAEPAIQQTEISGEKAVIVELPGVTDVTKAKKLIGKTAQLKFYEQAADPITAENNPEAISGFVPTDLTGANLSKADVEFQGGQGGQQGMANEPVVALKFDSEGAKLFKDITTRNLQKPVAIVLDGQIISAPTVQTAIENGDAIISGQFTIETAKDLSIQLNAGALPVPINLIEERTIGATLGAESIRKSITAGLLGILLLVIFMIAFYRVPGVLAVLALLAYSLIVLALFKLIPVTLTLAGIAGFILSLGMAVDANVLIFERMKEEIREGAEIEPAVKEGFKRAWSSIRDSNVSTLITCVILFWLGTGIVRGFALTLGIGVLISMFSAITITRNLLNLTAMTKIGRKLIKRI